jgi:antitoxin component YwqK of YwqJK toxin-antitoxin module
MLPRQFNLELVIFIVLSKLILFNTGCNKYEYEENKVYFIDDSAFTLDGKPLTGTIMSYFLVSGEKYTEEKFVNGVRNGKSIVYYKSGSLQREVSYENGLRDGFHITYFEQGPKARIKSFKKGIAHGPEIHYSLDGDIWRDMEFENGRQISRFRHIKSK